MFASVRKKFGGAPKEKTKEYSKTKSKSKTAGFGPKTPRVNAEEDLSVTIDSNAMENFAKAKVKTVSVTSNINLEEDIATIFSEGDDDTAISILKDNIESMRAKASPKLWFMLMDIYTLKNNQEEFNNLALDYAQAFSTSPPSWESLANENAREMAGGGQNMLILEPILKPENIERFREFLKSAKDEKFCRINVSQCKFEQNDPKTIEKILKLFTDLRRAKVTSILMGDNNLSKFCKTYIYPEAGEERSLKPELKNIEQTIWLLYLELLQWKGLQEDFENTALEYAEKFEISPPGWEDDGIMTFRPTIKELTEEDIEVEFDNDISSNNIDKILNFINEKFELGEDATINFRNINRIDFGGAGALSFHIQELWGNPQYSERKVILKYPNELVISLLNMVGCNEFVTIIERNRR